MTSGAGIGSCFTLVGWTSSWRLSVMLKLALSVKLAVNFDVALDVRFRLDTRPFCSRSIAARGS
jgi:hypothetical protein